MDSMAKFCLKLIILAKDTSIIYLKHRTKVKFPHTSATDALSLYQKQITPSQTYPKQDP